MTGVAALGVAALGVTWVSATRQTDRAMTLARMTSLWAIAELAAERIPRDQARRCAAMVRAQSLQTMASLIRRNESLSVDQSDAVLRWAEVLISRWCQPCGPGGGTTCY